MICVQNKLVSVTYVQDVVKKCSVFQCAVHGYVTIVLINMTM